MKTKFTTLNVVTTAMLAAVAVILASAFHSFGDVAISSLFSPMHFPVLLCGVLCGPYLGLICGVVTPLMSFLATGGARPPFPGGLVPMIFELATYGFVIGLMRWLLLKNAKTHRIASLLALVIAMVAGRIVNSFVGAFFVMSDSTTYFVALGAKLASSFASTWAGIVLQLVLIPALLFALQRSGVLIKYLPDTPFAAQHAQGGTETAEQASEIAADNTAELADGPSK